MTDRRQDDLFEGDFGRRKPRAPEPAAKAPKVRTAGESRVRSAWFNRSRGAGAVKLAEARDPASQRVIVKARFVVHDKVGAGGGGGGALSLMRHTLYVEREGAGRDGDEVKVFDRQLEKADGAAFVDRCADDRHHFRIIISPENGAELQNLRDYTRELMDRAERDLGTRLDWIAAEHHDTGRPHIHLLIRGVRDNGRDLIIPRAYISYGMRDLAQEIATRELGPRLENGLSRELDTRAERAAKLERPTHLDALLREHARDNDVRLTDLPQDAGTRGPLVQRLNRLEDWGLAQRADTGVWRLDPALEDKLTRLGDVRERERATARLMAKEDRGIEPERLRELEAAHSSHRATGRLIGFEQMGGDPRGPFVIAIEGIDGKVWTARVATRERLREIDGVERGAILQLERSAPTLKPADRTILAVARETGLAYSAELHAQTIPSDRANYIQMHERRLEALRRVGIVERSSDGVFRLPADYEAKVRQYEGRGARQDVRLTLLDPHSLERQTNYRGPTWLDRISLGLEDISQLKREHFGREVREAWENRARTLDSMGIARHGDDRLHGEQDWQRQLRQIEREDLLKRIERDTGRVPHFARDGDRVAGVFAQRIRAAERGFAVIFHGRSATLVPWRAEMERASNQLIAGRVNERGFDFKVGREAEKAMKAMTPWLGR
jgi:type IV secretory pathway VirD2 relaxase